MQARLIAYIPDGAAIARIVAPGERLRIGRAVGSDLQLPQASVSRRHAELEQQADGTRLALPKPSIDTGMGLERIAAVMQGVHDNYDVDLFRSLIAASEEATGVRAEGERAPSHRVIADHLRSSSFLIADGVSPARRKSASAARWAAA